jgi:hypothetical protein
MTNRDRNALPPFVSQFTAPHKCLFLLEQSCLNKVHFWKFCIFKCVFHSSSASLSLLFVVSFLFLLFKSQYVFYSLLWLRFIFRSSFLSFFFFGDLLLFLHTILSLTAFRRFSKSNLKSIRQLFYASISIIQEVTTNMRGQAALNKTCYRVPTQNFDCSVLRFIQCRWRYFRKWYSFTFRVERLGQNFSPKWSVQAAFRVRRNLCTENKQYEGWGCCGVEWSGVEME